MSMYTHTRSNTRFTMTLEDLEQPEFLFDLIQISLGDVWQYLPDDLDGEDFAEESSTICLIQSLNDQSALESPNEIAAKIKEAVMTLKEHDYLRAFALAK